MITIEATKTRKNAKIVRQPVGTNHFQFRVHQLDRGLEGRGGGFCSTELFYLDREARCKQSLRCDLAVRFGGTVRGRDFELDLHRLSETGWMT